MNSGHVRGGFVTHWSLHLNIDGFSPKIVLFQSWRKASKPDRMILVQAKLLYKVINEDIIFSTWRISELSCLASIKSEAALNVHAHDVPSDNLTLFSYQAGLRMLHEYSGWLADGETRNAMDAVHVAGSIVTLIRVDYLMATKFFCFREHVSDEQGGSHQKLYHATFVSSLPLSYSPLVGSIGSFV